MAAQYLSDIFIYLWPQCQRSPAAHFVRRTVGRLVQQFCLSFI